MKINSILPKRKGGKTMRKMRKLLLTLLASTLTSVATSGMDSKSGWMLYEPDLPECLKK